MDGPSFYCAYLGFNPVSKPPTSLTVLQNPIKELYYKYRKSPASGRSASLKLTQQGVLVVLYEDGVVKTELFFEFSSVIFVEAAKFVPVKTSSERKPKAIFVPVDESKGAVSDKNAFLVEKTYHFLVSSTHPPLVVCVVRRPTGVKALDCHVFALDTIENSLHITALISSTQMPTSPTGKPEVDLGKNKGSFDRGARGDVIRTDHGDYSIYRGPQGYEPPPSAQRFSGGPAPGRNGYMGVPMVGMQGPPQGGMQGLPPGGMQGGPPPGGMHGGLPPGGMHGGLPPGGMHGGPPPGGMQGGHPPGGMHGGLPPGGMHGGPPQGGMQGPIILTQDIFREPPSANQQYYGGPPGPGGYGMYDHQNYLGPQGAPYLRQPDVIMHARQRSEDSAENELSFSGSDHSAGGVRMRYDEVNLRNEGNRLSTSGMPLNRMSGGPGPANRLSGGPVGSANSPRPQNISSSGGPQYTSWQMDKIPSPNAPMGGINSPKSPPSVFSPNPRGNDGPVFSMSNLESRIQAPDDEPDEPNMGGRPVAKVPPHLKAGVKVLPSDFRMVKLKPKTDRKSDTSEESTGYDNQKELMEKYKELQENERDAGYSGGMKQIAGKPNNFPDGDGFRDFSEGNKGLYQDDRNKDFMSNWNESVKEHKNVRQAGSRDYIQRPEDNNNKHRYSSSGYEDNGGNGRQASQSPDDMDGNQDDPVNRIKQKEIADMFSNFTIQGNNNVVGGYRLPGDRSEIEDGLGYLP